MEPNYIGLSERIRETVDRFFSALFPRFFGGEPSSFSGDGLEEKSRIEMDLAAQALTKALLYVLPREQAVHCVKQTMERMDQIRKMLQTDIQAAYEGDPAAISPDEVILCYPAFRAIVVYRIAHCLYILKVPIIPRMMTELAHNWTGIDIHPGATIGPSFFIDHGTGVVIGETCTIGSRVKLYQHVTLGAKSFKVADDGSLVKGIKRHPDIGSDVVIYAGATVLGSDTKVGDGCVIGGSVWLTHSIPPGTVLTTKYETQLHV